jgi:hypothetical protein
MINCENDNSVNDLGYVSIWLRTQVIAYQTKPTLHVLVNGETWAGAFAVFGKMYSFSPDLLDILVLIPTYRRTVTPVN